MNKIKISYRSPVVWNMISFIFFSFFFLLLQDIYGNTSSITDRTLISQFIMANKYVAGILGLTIVLVYRLSRFAIPFYWLSVGITFALTFLSLSNEFSKFVIIILFFYLLFAFYLYQFFVQDRSESYYNSLFTENDLFRPMCKQIKVELTSKDGRDHIGHLTNWSDEGFFVYLNEPIKIGGKVSAKVRYEEADFECTGHIVSRLGTFRGYGLKVYKEKESSKLGWSKFIGIIKEMGFKPELLR